MSVARHQVRRAELPQPEDGEAQLWPVTILLLILAGAVAGIIIAISEFDAPELLENGWFRLGVLTLSVGILLGAAALLRGRVLARVQMAVMVSLVFHLAILLVMLEKSLLIELYTFVHANQAIEEEDLVKLPDYGIPVHNLANSKQAFEKPVDTPIPQQKPVEVEKQNVPKQAKAQKKPNPREQPSDVPQPQPVELKREEVSTPRRAEKLAGLRISRRESELTEQKEALQTTELPRRQQSSKSKPALQPQIDSVQRTAEDHSTPRRHARQEVTEPTAPVELEQVALQRQPTPERTPAEFAPQSPVEFQRQPTEQVVLQRPDAAGAVELAARPADQPQPSEDSPSLQAADAGAVRKAIAAGPSSPRPVSQSASGGPSTASVAVGQPDTAEFSRVNVTERGLAVARNVGSPGQMSRANLASKGLDGIARGEAVQLAAANPQTQQASGGTRVTRPAPAASAGGVNRRSPAPAGGSLARRPGNPTPGLPGETTSGVALPTGGLRSSRDSQRLATGSNPTGAQGSTGLPRSQVGQFNPLGGPDGIDDLAELTPVVPSRSGGSPSTGADRQGTLDGPQFGSLQRRAAGGIRVTLNAPVGPGGLAVETSLEVGSPQRRANDQSEVVNLQIARFILQKSFGKTTSELGDPGQVPATFMLRDPKLREKIAEQFGGNRRSEEAVEMGLDYLARVQQPDGHWLLHGEAGRSLTASDRAKESPSAATGLALLAFLGAGYDHQGGKYREVVQDGLKWLIKNQKADGDLYVRGSNDETRMYSHGIAAIPLCEAYAMTRDPALRQPAQKALNFIMKAQDSYGGWRYRPADGTRLESDTSVTGWQMMALKSGQLAGLSVSQQSFQGVSRWLDFATGRERNPAKYAYLPHPNADPHQRRVSPAMTAEGLLMRLYLGWNRDHKSLREGADYLARNLPPRSMYDQRNVPNCYYWYYATQVMFQLQGKYWEVWNGRLRDLLINSQERRGELAGSWSPRQDQWGRQGGRIYVTAMHLLMLEVYYRHLPLFRLEEEPARSVQRRSQTSPQRARR